MTFIILKLLYNIFFGGIMFYLLFLLSNLLFGNGTIKNKTLKFIEGVLIAPFWVLLIFSPKGRQKLFNIIKKL